MGHEGAATTRHHRTRHYTVDLNPIFNTLFRKGLRQSNDGSVGGRYGRETWFRIQGSAP
jgi:hypothetical protein